MLNNSIDTTNLDSLKEIIGDDLKEIVLNFIESSPETLKKINLALQDENADDLTLHAHTLKGSGANMGAIKLAEICAELENKGNQDVTTGLTANIAELKVELAKVNKSLQNLYLNPASKHVLQDLDII